MARTEVNGRQIKDQSVDLTVDVTGVLPVANGGSGSTTLALNNVLLGNGVGALQAVAPGTSGNVLTSDGSTWVSSPSTGGGGGGGGAQSISTITSPATLGSVTGVSYVALVGAGGAVTLPTAVGNGNRYTVKNITAAYATVTTTSAQTIDGTTTITLAPDEAVDIVSDGTNWRII